MIYEIQSENINPSFSIIWFSINNLSPKSCLFNASVTIHITVENKKVFQHISVLVSGVSVLYLSLSDYVGHHVTAVCLQTAVSQRLKSHLVAVKWCRLLKTMFYNQQKILSISLIESHSELKVGIMSIDLHILISAIFHVPILESLFFLSVQTLHHMFVLWGFTCFAPSNPQDGQLLLSLVYTPSSVWRLVCKICDASQKMHMEQFDFTYLFCISNPECYVIKAEEPSLLMLRTRTGI